VCMNSGTEDGAGRCVCPQNFLGFHCEIDANKTLQHQYGLSGHSSRFQRFGTDQVKSSKKMNIS
jgi:hypothetical protein